MLIKLIIVLLLIAIIVALVSGGVFLVKDPSTSKRTVRALSWRVGLQVALIVLLVLAFFMGWLKPHGVGG
ncbi:MAG: twin transmembrane helix small protein [Panacagrimonas sp.]